MKTNELLKAIEILSLHHSNEVIINKVSNNGSIGNLCSGEPSLHVVNCVPAAINELLKAGFTLSMDHGFLSVYVIGSLNS